MIQMKTLLNVADNSGAKQVQCIKVLGGTRRKYARIGDIIVVAVKDALPNTPIKKGGIEKAVVVRTRKEYKRPDGHLYPLRRQCVRRDRREQQPEGKANLRPRGPRAAGEGLHEDRVPGARSAVGG